MWKLALMLALATGFSRRPQLESTVASAVSSIPKPRPELSFVHTDKSSIRVAIRWDQNPPLELRNEVRDRILWAVRRELAGEKRLISVVFTDEITSQGWK